MELSSLYKEVIENHFMGFAFAKITYVDKIRMYESKIVQANSSFISYVHGSELGIIDSHFEEYFPADRDIIQSNYKKLINEKQSVKFELYSNNNGKCIEVSIFHLHEDVYNFTLIDCTQKKNIELAWNKSESNVRAIFNSGEQSIILLDKNYIIQAFNRNAEILSMKINKVSLQIGKSILDYFDSRYKSQFMRFFNYVLAGDIITKDYNFRLDGSIDNWQELRLSPVHNDFGGTLSILLSLTPINSRKESEKKTKKLMNAIKFASKITDENMKRIHSLNIELADSERKLKEINANKDRLFSIIAHDLKSPLQGFLSLTNQLLIGFDVLEKEEIREFSIEMNESANRIYKLLDNLLHWSKVQRNKIEFHPIEIDLDTIIRMNIELFTTNLSVKKIKLVNSIQPGIILFADVNMINTVIRNLLSNAIKYTFAEGTIEISTKYIDEYYVELSVSDDGTGMDDKTLMSLFKIDQSISNPGTFQEMGTGLGLILCKELIEKNGGTIDVFSKLGQGSSFRITIPLFNEIN